MFTIYRFVFVCPLCHLCRQMLCTTPSTSPVLEDYMEAHCSPVCYPFCNVSVFLSLCPHVQMKLMKLLQRLPASVVRRLHRERYRKPTWLTPIPDSHKLTEENITDFVESMMQPVLLAMFSKTGSLDAAQALQNLALMRPELVIPPVLEK